MNAKFGREHPHREGDALISFSLFAANAIGGADPDTLI